MGGPVHVSGLQHQRTQLMVMQLINLQAELHASGLSVFVVAREHLLKENMPPAGHKHGNQCP